MTNFLQPFTEQDLGALCSVRQGECKVGQQVLLLEHYVAKTTNLREALLLAVEAGARFALLGIPEDIGPRANFGRGGAEQSWLAAIEQLLNMQHNKFFPSAQVLLVGQIACQDLMAQSLCQTERTVPASAGEDSPVSYWRHLTSRLDDRVFPIIEEIVASGLIPIVVGGGHNNCYPIIKGVALAPKLQQAQLTQQPMAVINCDPHADFRMQEGRHSGNGFTYAYEAGYLKEYLVWGLHEANNSQEMLERLQTNHCRYVTFESLYERQEVAPEVALAQQITYLTQTGLPVGLELDLDALALMPSSAMAPYGLSVREAAAFIHTVAANLPVSYLHLPEGAPALGAEQGARIVGKALAHLIATFIKAKIQ